MNQKPIVQYLLCTLLVCLVKCFPAAAGVYHKPATRLAHTYALTKKKDRLPVNLHATVNYQHQAPSHCFTTYYKYKKKYKRTLEQNSQCLPQGRPLPPYYTIPHRVPVNNPPFFVTEQDRYLFRLALF